MSPIRPDTPEWDDLVKRGQALDADRNWFLGDAALRIAPMGDDRSNNGALSNVRLYADQIGVDEGSLLKYRQVANAWPHENRVSSAPWKVHQILMRADRHNLVVPGMTVTEAARAAGHKGGAREGVREPSRMVETWTPDQRRQVAHELLGDPDVLDDHGIRAHIEAKVASDPAMTNNVRSRAESDFHPRPPREPQTLPEPIDLPSERFRREHGHGPFDPAVTQLEMQLADLLGRDGHGWRDLHRLLTRVNDHNVEMDHETYQAMVREWQLVGVALREYAIRHGLPVPASDRVEEIA